MEDIKILSDDEISNLFGNNEEEPKNQEDKRKISDDEASEIFSQNNEFDDEEQMQEPEPSKPVKEDSNNQNVDFTTILSELVDEGILDVDDFESIKDKDSIKKLIQESISKGIDDETRRVKEAIELGLSVQDIAEYENTIKYLHGIQKENLLDDSDEGFKLRQKLIVQDFINQGDDEKTAVEKTNAIFKKGDDMNAAEKALENNKKFFKDSYDNLVEDKKKEASAAEEEINKQTAELKEAIFSEDKFLGEVELDDKIKKLALKNLSEPIYKDKATGQMLTPMQKYQRENKTDFLKNIGLLFTLTDNFKNMNKFFSQAIKKRMNKEINEIEDVLKNPEKNDNNITQVANKKAQLIDNFKFAL